jgi:hypothetical protein
MVIVKVEFASRGWRLGARFLFACRVSPSDCHVYEIRTRLSDWEPSDMLVVLEWECERVSVGEQ